MKFDFNKLEKIGEGEEKEVYIHPENEGKVVARFKEGYGDHTERLIKGRYYLTKILHTLMPVQIPDTNLVAKGEDIIMVSERKELDEPHKEHNRLRTQNSNSSDPAISEQYNKLREEREDKLVWDDKYIDFLTALSRLGVTTDPSASNFGYDKDDNLVYVDNNFKPWVEKNGQLVKNYDVAEILNVLNGVDEQTREMAKSYLERIEALFNEEQEIFNKNMENQPKQFDIENSPMREAYKLLDAHTPKELDNLYNDADQELMKAKEWDYNNPDLITNRVKDIIENIDENFLTEEEKEWRQMILWFWYHHAMSIAISKFGDKEKAKEFGAKAMKLNPEDNGNKITEIYYLLLNDKLAEAEELAVSIPEGILDDGNLNPEPQTARDLIEDYKKGMF